MSWSGQASSSSLSLSLSLCRSIDLHLYIIIFRSAQFVVVHVALIANLIFIYLFFYFVLILFRFHTLFARHRASNNKISQSLDKLRNRVRPEKKMKIISILKRICSVDHLLYGPMGRHKGKSTERTM